jgi:alkylresorcinol/alkylpyrone synthase
VTAISCVHSAFPPHYYAQDRLLDELRSRWGGRLDRPKLLERLHRNVGVGGRHLALPPEAYDELHSFGARNDAWIKAAVEVGERAIRGLLEGAGVDAGDIGCLVSTTVTGIAVPSVDARLMNRLPFSTSLKRIPLFGIGCVGGAAGIARAADYLRGHPDQLAVLLAVELCSLAIVIEDLSVANIVASGLFGDGAAAVLLAGEDHPLARGRHPRIVDNRSAFFHDTERVMGWDVGAEGLRIVLSASVPEVARTALPPVVEAFLADHGLAVSDIDIWVAHPGGPKVIDAMEEGLGLERGTLAASRESLQRVGNLSSVSVLLVLEETLREARPEPGAWGLLMAMGPGFSAEMVLLRW